MLTKVLLPDCRLGGDVGVPIRVNVGTSVKTLRMKGHDIMVTDTHCFIMLTFEMIWSARQDTDNQAELFSLSAPSVLNQIPKILSSGTEKWIGSLKWKLYFT